MSTYLTPFLTLSNINKARFGLGIFGIFGDFLNEIPKEDLEFCGVLFIVQ